MDVLFGLGNCIVVVLVLLFLFVVLLVVGNMVWVDIVSWVEEIGVLMLIGVSG